MKNLFAAILLTVCISTIANAQTADASTNTNAPSFQWVNDTYDFSNIAQGIPATATFEFVNNGKEPLIITDVQKTCGCTKTEWPEQPVMPGQKGVIKAEYNAATEGAFTKTITVNSNASAPSVKLTFKGTVVKDAVSGAPEQKTIFNQ
ncbi:MAG: DUF1573 domain-containing protein [Fimbriimonadaceae bacterium]|nr:DUF1573 domain-containing protein [Chitinophagales bacterium]